MSVVVITGCSSGIGLATAVAMAARGDTVVATMRNLDKAGPLQKALADAGAQAEVLRLDVTSDESVASLFADVLARHGRVDVLVNNAAIGCDGTLEELSLDEFRECMDTNLYGCLRTMKAAIPAMREAGAGRILNVSSMGGVVGQPFNDGYVAAKFALEGVSESLWPVLAPFNVFVSVIEPGPVQGDFRNKGVIVRDPNSPYAAMRDFFETIQNPAFDAAPTPADIAVSFMAAIDDPQPKPRYQTDLPTTKFVALKFKDVTGERVVGLTSKWVGA